MAFEEKRGTDGYLSISFYLVVEYILIFIMLFLAKWSFQKSFDIITKNNKKFIALMCIY